MSEGVGLRKDRLYLSHMALLKSPVWEIKIRIQDMKLCCSSPRKNLCRTLDISMKNLWFYALVSHVLDPLLYFGKGRGFTAIVKHRHHRLHAPEHLGQHLVLVGQGETWGGRLGQGVVALVRRRVAAEDNDGTHFSRASQVTGSVQGEGASLT